jgi:hypothetical protein
MKTKIISLLIIAIMILTNIGSTNALQGYSSNADGWAYYNYIETDTDTIQETNAFGYDLGKFQVADNITIFRTGYQVVMGGGTGVWIDLHVNENITKNIEYIYIINDHDTNKNNDFLTIRITYKNGKTETYKVNDYKGENKGTLRSGESLNLTTGGRSDNYYYKEFDLTNMTDYKELKINSWNRLNETIIIIGEYREWGRTIKEQKDVKIKIKYDGGEKEYNNITTNEYGYYKIYIPINKAL